MLKRAAGIVILLIALSPVLARAQVAETCAEAGGECVDIVECARRGGVGGPAPELCTDEDLPICCISASSGGEAGSGEASAPLTDAECRDRCLTKVNNCLVILTTYNETQRTAACNALCSAFSGRIDGASWDRCIGSPQVACTTLVTDSEWQGIGACLEGGSTPSGGADSGTATTTGGGGSSGGRSGTTVTLPDPLGGRNLPEVIGQAIRAFAGIAGAIALLLFVYGGVYWIYSGGEQEKIGKAVSILRNALIGLVLIFGAYFFTSAIVQGILATSAPDEGQVETQP